MTWIWSLAVGCLRQSGSAVATMGVGEEHYRNARDPRFQTGQDWHRPTSVWTQRESQGPCSVTFITDERSLIETENLSVQTD